MRLLEQTTFALKEGDRPGAGECQRGGRRVAPCVWCSTHLLRSSLIGLISILRRPMARACGYRVSDDVFVCVFVSSECAETVRLSRYGSTRSSLTTW